MKGTYIECDICGMQFQDIYKGFIEQKEVSLRVDSALFKPWIDYADIDICHNCIKAKDLDVVLNKRAAVSYALTIGRGT